MSKFVRGIGALLVLVTVGGIVLGTAMVEKVKPGYIGVVYAPSTGTQEDTLSQGWHLISPFKKVTSFSIATEQLFMSQDEREGSKGNESFDARCKDGKMNVDFEMSYSFDSEKIPALFTKYRGMSGEDIIDNIIRGKIKTYVNEVTSKYTVLEAHMEKKTELNNDILAHLKEKLLDFGIVVESANLMNTRVDETIEAAITERSRAAQELEAEKQKAERAKVEAERMKVEAEGKAEVQKIEAQAQAEANKILQQSLTSEMLQQQWIEKWDGKLSVVSGSDSNVVLNGLNLGE